MHPPIDPKVAAGLMAPLTELVVRAGSAILKVDRSRMRIDGKSDGSPVTEADLASDRIIADGLKQLAPNIPSLSEEQVTREQAGCPGLFFLVDPLDGTKEFVAGRDEFTVNIALVADGTPLLGIIGAPALGLIWRGLVGQGTDKGADKRAERLSTTNGIGPAEPIHTRPFPRAGQPWVAAVSRSHGDALTKPSSMRGPGGLREKLGSAVKFGRVAEGAVDIYPRLAPTSEWDIAAGHALVTAAGGRITDAAGGDLRFGGERISSCRPSSPGAIRTRVRRLCSVIAIVSEAIQSFSSLWIASLTIAMTTLLRQLLLDRRPAQCRLLHKGRRIGGEGVAGLLAPEQVKPVPHHEPEQRIAGHGDAPRQIDRIVAAILRAVDVRMGDKGGAIALVAEAPDRAALRGFKLRQTHLGLAVDEIGQRVEPPDGQAAITVGHQAFRR